MAMQEMKVASDEDLGKLVVQAGNEADIVKFAETHSKLIVAKQKNYYDIDVEKAMMKLASCGSLLRLAYASSDGSKCHKDVGLLLSKYGSMVKDSYVTSSSFVSSSLTALNYHKLAIKLAGKGKMEKALTFVAKCAKVANEMSVEANKLAVRAQGLVDLADTAFGKACQDKTLDQQEREKMVAAMEKAKEKRKEMEKMQEDLKKKYEEAQEKEAEAIYKADAERKRKFTLEILKIAAVAGTAMVSSTAAAAGAVGTVAQAGAQAYLGSGQQQESEEKKEDGLDAMAVEMIKQRHEINRKMIKQAEELSETVSELAGMGVKHSSLQKAIKSLEIAIKTLGKIKVIFDNTRVFWIGVEKNCKKIVENADTVKEMADVDKEEMIDAIAESALNWFVLGKANHTAKEAISEVDKGMDQIISNLPTEEEALKLIPELSEKMKSLLLEEVKALKDASAAEK